MHNGLYHSGIITIIMTNFHIKKSHAGSSESWESGKSNNILLDTYQEQ